MKNINEINKKIIFEEKCKEFMKQKHLFGVSTNSMLVLEDIFFLRNDICNKKIKAGKLLKFIYTIPTKNTYAFIDENENIIELTFSKKQFNTLLDKAIFI